MNKYELTTNTKIVDGKTLYQIRALKDFGDGFFVDNADGESEWTSEVKAGDLGGYIESEDNLLQEYDCWVFDNACVYGNAEIAEDATVRDNAKVHGNAIITDSCIYGNADVCGDVDIDLSEIGDNAKLSGKMMVLCSNIKGNAELSGEIEMVGCEICGNVKISGEHKFEEITIKNKNDFVKASIEELE